MAGPATFTRPSRGDELELTIDSLAHGGNGVARLDGYVVFVAGAVPGDRVRAVVGKSKKAYAEARTVEVLEPSPDRIPPGRRPSRRALAGAALRAPARGQGRAGRRRAGADRPPRGLRAGADRARRAAVGLPQQARVLVRHRPRRRARLRLPRARPLGRDRRRDRQQARVRARQRGPRAGARLVPRAGPARLGPPHAPRRAAQPRRPRGPPDRRDPGAADHLARQARRRLADRGRRRRGAVLEPDGRPGGEHVRAARRRCSRARRSCASGSSTSTS